MEFLARTLILIVERQDLVVLCLLQHVRISLIAILLIVVVGVPLGLFIGQYRIFAQPVIYLTGILYTIPVLALFGFLIPFFGIGDRPTFFALFIYGLLPVVRNTFVGVTTVDEAVLEAARGMGCTELQLLAKIRLPLAMPMIISGIRTITVMTISIATIAAFIGAGGLGVLIFRGITTYNTELTFAGSLLVAGLALGADGVLAVMEKQLLKRTR
jgi:osmoprotectant transport system permease protein